MINDDILNALQSHFKLLTHSLTLVIQAGSHSKKQELMDFLHQIASVSDKISIKEKHYSDALRSPLSFTIFANEAPTGIVFSGIPSGHEFNSLILALLRAGGSASKLDESIISIIQAIDEPLKFEVFVSLSCHNCPDVVQALNDFSLLNSNISSEMIDGGLFPELISARDIQGVPSVYLNGELFANGKLDAAILLEHLIKRYPTLLSVSAQPSSELQDVTVIGGGPAGVSAAIYAARKGLKVTLIADRFGGQVKDTMGIENLISVSQTTGPQLVGAMQSHMNEYAITQKEHVKVEAVSIDQSIKHLQLNTGDIISTKSLIVATGARWRELDVPGEKENVGNGVAYCPHCDGPFFKGKEVAVIGGGNSGIEAALDLSMIVKSVHVFEFMPDLKADSVLVEKAMAKDNIHIINNAATQAIKSSNGKVSALEYKDRQTNEVKTLELSGVFVQIGLVPNSQFITDVVDTSQYGEIIIDEKGRTSIPGIFSAGDVTTVPYKQIIISMGEGAKASLSAFEYLLTEYTEHKNVQEQSQVA